MNIEEKDIDAIRDYWKNNLGEAERHAFEQRMAADPVFRETVEEHRLLLMAVKSKGDAELWAWVQTLGKQVDTPQKEDGMDAPRQHSAPEAASSQPLSMEKTAYDRMRQTIAGLSALLILLTFLFFWERSKSRQTQSNNATAILLAQRDSTIAALRADQRKVQQQLDSLLNQQHPSPAQPDASLKAEIRRLQTALENTEAALRRCQQGNANATEAIVMNLAPSPAKFNRRSPSRDANGENNPSRDTLKAIRNAIATQQFKRAEDLLKRISLKDDSIQTEVLHLIPYVYFYQKKYEASIPALLQLKDIDSSEASNVRWYLVLCYSTNLSKYKLEAQLLLKSLLRDADDPYFEAAQRLEAQLGILK